MKVLRDARQEALVEELGRFRATEDEQGAKAVRDRSSMLKLAESTISAFSRDTYEPGHFTASAFVLSPDRRRLLLIRHSKLETWLQPGGHVESTDRDHVAAARREVKEETNLGELELVDRLFDLDVHQIPALGEAPPHLHHDLRAAFVASSEEVSAGDDAADARWFELSQVIASQGPLADGWATDDSVRRAARLLASLVGG